MNKETQELIDKITGDLTLNFNMDHPLVKNICKTLDEYLDILLKALLEKKSKPYTPSKTEYIHALENVFKEHNGHDKPKEAEQ